MEVDGYSGLADRRKGKPSAQRIPLAVVEEVLRLFKETYYDLNIRHFHRRCKCPSKPVGRTSWSAFFLLTARIPEVFQRHGMAKSDFVKAQHRNSG